MSEQSKERDTKEPGKKYHFFVDAKKYDYPHASITGAEIKNVAGVTPTYQLFLEAEGDAPDSAVSDGATISLEGGAKHFYAVPPATFGVQ